MRWDYHEYRDDDLVAELKITDGVYAMVSDDRFGPDVYFYVPKLQTDEETIYEGPPVDSIHHAEVVAIAMAEQWLIDRVAADCAKLAELGGAW